MPRAYSVRSLLALLVSAALAACSESPATPRHPELRADAELTLPPDPSGPFVITWDDWTSVSAGGDHSCALTASGKIYCWGSNALGQLGSAGGDALRPRAVDLTSLPTNARNFKAVSAGGDHTCALTTQGYAYCWGNGIGSTPAAAPLGLTYSAISVGNFEACALSPLGYAYCWTFGGTPTPVTTAPLSLTFTSISVGFDQKCGVATSTGRAYCWGDNGSGQLGINSYGSRSRPTELMGGGTWYGIDAGKSFTCGVRQAPVISLLNPGGAYCWGAGGSGQVGNALTIGSPKPEVVWDPPGAALDIVTAGGEHACGIELAANGHGDAWCWGNNTSGQLGGTGPSISVPVQVSGPRVYKQISAGRDHTCALSRYTRATNVAGAVATNALIQCWGLNSHGQLGNLSTNPSDVPVNAIHPQVKLVMTLAP
jgi:alpha-tubulin suppressor-like RCC1 family protein